MQYSSSTLIPQTRVNREDNSLLQLVPQQNLTMVQNVRLFLATYGTSVRKKGTHNFAWLFQKDAAKKIK
jgi:hypothetical protein